MEAKKKKLILDLISNIFVSLAIAFLVGLIITYLITEYVYLTY